MRDRRKRERVTRQRVPGSGSCRVRVREGCCRSASGGCWAAAGRSPIRHVSFPRRTAACCSKLGGPRLVVEAPGLQRAAAAARIPPPVEPLVTASAPATEEAPHAEIWWLIAAAAALAAIIALLLYYRW